MISVKLLNPETVRDLYKNHGEFARVCYATDERYSEKVGESCAESGHMSGSRCEYIKFLVKGIDRGTAEQCLRHEIGTWVPVEMQDNYSFAELSEQFIEVNPASIVKNMASFRYIDKDGFEYATPSVIEKDEQAREAFDQGIAALKTWRKSCYDILLEHGVDEKKATEAVNLLLPRATTTEFVIGFTPEALIHFCHKRMCNRAQEFIREMAFAMKREVEEVNARFSAELMPHCDYLLYCPEGKHSCGRRMTKAQLREKLNYEFIESRLKQTSL